MDTASWLRDWGGLVLSGVAVALSGLALRHTRLWLPKPLMVVETSKVTGNVPGSAPEWNVRVHNRGTGDALDVQLIFGAHVARLDIMSRGDSISFTRNLTELDPGGGFDPYNNTLNSYLPGPVDISGLRANLTWRQAPHTNRLRANIVKVQ